MSEYLFNAITVIASTVCSAAVAIIVPLVSKNIDRKMQSEKLRNEIYLSNRIQCIEGFIQHVRAAIVNSPDHYTKSYFCDSVLMYIDASLHHYVMDICSCLAESKFDRASDLLTEFASKIKAIDQA